MLHRVSGGLSAKLTEGVHILVDAEFNVVRPRAPLFVLHTASPCSARGRIYQASAGRTPLALAMKVAM